MDIKVSSGKHKIKVIKEIEGKLFERYIFEKEITIGADAATKMNAKLEKKKMDIDEAKKLVKDDIGYYVAFIKEYNDAKFIERINKYSNSGNIDKILVNSGTFKMGNNNGNSDEKPIHSVTVSSFRISKYEITNQQN